MMWIQLQLQLWLQLHLPHHLLGYTTVRTRGYNYSYMNTVTIIVRIQFHLHLSYFMWAIFASYCILYFIWAVASYTYMLLCLGCLCHLLYCYFIYFIWATASCTSILLYLGYCLLHILSYFIIFVLYCYIYGLYRPFVLCRYSALRSCSLLVAVIHRLCFPLLL